jgi:general secretion pathway protein F
MSMALFRYKAVAASGELVEGDMEAESRGAAVARLHELGHVLIRADERAGLALSVASLVSRLGGWRGPAVDLTMLTRQLALLLRAGLSLDRALEIIEGLTASRPDRELVHRLLDRIRSGKSLADAMSTQPGRFPKFYLGMVRAGEASATLEASFERLGELLERARLTSEQIKSALIYPAVVVLTACLSLGVLFGFVVPSFRPLFEGAGDALPTVTKLVLACADLVGSGWWAMLLFLLLSGLGLRWWLAGSQGRAWRDRNLLALPVVGNLVCKTEIARFSRVLGTLLRSGVSPLLALGIAQETMRNGVMAAAVAGAIGGIKEGKGLAEPLARTGMVPDLAIQLIRVGEETARLEDMLLKVADIFDDENRRMIERLLALLVPAVTVVLGALVALVVGSILMAMLSVYDLAI